MSRTRDATLYEHDAMQPRLFSRRWIGLLQSLSASCITTRHYRVAVVASSIGLRLRPHDGVCLFNRALALKQLDRLTGASAAFDTLIDLSPDDCDARHHRADVRCDLGRWSEAIDDYTAILRRTNNDANALLNRGTAYANLKQWDLAEADFRAALALAPDDVMAWRNLERVHQKTMCLKLVDQPA